ILALQSQTAGRVSSAAAPRRAVRSGRHRGSRTGPRFPETLGDDRPLYGFRAKGLGDNEAPHRRVAGMAADYVPMMRGVQPERRGRRFLPRCAEAAGLVQMPGG
ncbi:MAG: hypothetical protein AB7P22_14955, partial [Vicinamibacterales bacterium]